MTTSTMPADTATPKERKSPSAIAYTVHKGKERNFWARMGAQFEHEDGKGSSLLLDVVPLDGRIIVRKSADPDAVVEAAAEEPAKGTEEKAKSRLPDQIAYSIRDVGERSFWTEIGIAYKHREDKGLTITLHSIPMNNRVVLRDRSEPVAKEPATVDA